MPKTKPPIALTRAEVADRVVLTRAEAALFLKIDIQTIDALIKSKKLRASRLGAGTVRPAVRIRAADVEAMLAANPAVQS